MAECTVADPTGTPLNFRQEPGGKVIGNLPNGLTVLMEDYEASDKWVRVRDFTGAYIGYVYRPYLHCVRDATSKRYPVILSWTQLRSLGLTYSESRLGDAQKCFYIGDGLYGLGATPDKVARLKSQGTKFDVFCFATRNDGLRFDPETGTRLKTFAILEELPDFAFEFPLEVPNCLRRSTVSFEPQSNTATISYRNCTIRFNPFTGRSITKADKSRLLKYGASISGEAGPEPSEASLASIKGKGPASAADFKKLAAGLK